MTYIQKLLIVGVTLLFFGCNSTSTDKYFKLTLTDQPNPVGLLPECIEVSSNGQLVILTNRFNEGDEIYQRTYFIELNKQQLDSVKTLMNFLQAVKPLEKADSTLNYKVKLDVFENSKRKSELFILSDSDVKFSELVNYCKALSDNNKRYSMKQSYYFNTEEICLKPLAN